MKQFIAITFSLIATTVNAGSWQYQEIKDELTGKKTGGRVALLRSSNSPELVFPYGKDVGSMTVSRRDVTDKPITTFTTGGLTSCYSYGATTSRTTVRVMFDNEEPKSYEASCHKRSISIADSHTVEDMIKMFERIHTGENLVVHDGAGDFSAKVINAKRIRVELPVYNNGRVIYEFTPNKPLMASLKAE